MKVGQVLLNEYEVQKEYNLPDVNMQAFLLKSKKNNITVIKVIPNDKQYNEATFDISFRTPPFDSTGVQHIIEHSVLSGSKYFNVKEPFQVLLQSSLQTYLNAGTYTEHTVYPVSSRNEKDYYNLVSVYLDAVFDPIFYEDERVFLQEGHHMRIVDGRLEHTGVVLNEMRGVFSHRDDVASLELKSQIFKKGCMHHNSGGTPSKIVTLTYENFKKYHSEYYTTDNATVMFLSHFDILTELKLLQKFTQNARRGKQIKYEKETEKHNAVCEKKMGVNQSDKNLTYYCCGYWLYDIDTVSTEELLLHPIIDELIHDSPASPFKKVLSGNFRSSFDSSELQPHIFLFNIGNTDTFQEFQNKVKQVYQQITSDEDEYLTKDLIQAQIHKKRIKLRTIKDNYGIQIANKLFKGILYGNELDTHFHYDSVYAALLKNDDIVKLVKNIIKKSYAQNVALNMIPEVGYAEKQLQEEQNELKQLYEKMTEQQRQDIIAKDQYVHSRQESEDTSEMLQRFGQLLPEDIHNIGDDIRSLMGQTEYIGSTKVFKLECNGNGIVNIHLCFDLTDHVTLDDVADLNFLSYVLKKVPTDTYADIRQLQMTLDKYTAEMDIYLSPIQSVEKDDEVAIYLDVSTSCLVENMRIVLELIKDIIYSSHKHLTQERIAELRNEYIQEQKTELLNSCHMCAASRILSAKSAFSYVRDYIIGPKSIHCLSEKPMDKFQKILGHISEPSQVNFGGITSELSKLTECYKEVFSSSASPKKQSVKKLLKVALQQHKSIAAPINVNYVALGGVFKDKVTSELLIMQNILRTGYLWDKIRVIGGAYGCIVQLQISGKLTITTYRDPRLQGSIDDIKSSIQYMRTADLTDKQLWGQKVATLGKNQTPISPRARFNQAVNYNLISIDIPSLAAAVDGIANTSLDQIQKTSQFLEKVLNGNAVVVGKADEVKAFTNDYDEF